MLTKLVNKNRNDYDKHLGVVLFAYYKHMAHTIPIGVWISSINVYKISTSYFHQRKYYIIDTMKALTNRIYELEKLKET
jgi:hypothetical protein